MRSTRYSNAVAALEFPTPGLVAGVDEAGRGPLAGPVVAAAVILDERHPIAGLADSKALTERQRERVRREAESKLVGQLFDRNPGKFAVLTDSQDRHKIGSRNPRNAVYIDGSVGILREADETAEN